MVVLKSPKLEGDRLTFGIDVLEGDLAGADGPASVFIDIIRRPLTPPVFCGYVSEPHGVALIIAGPLLPERRLSSALRPLPGGSPTTRHGAATTPIRLATEGLQQAWQCSAAGEAIEIYAGIP